MVLDNDTNFIITYIIDIKYIKNIKTIILSRMIQYKLNKIRKRSV